MTIFAILMPSPQPKVAEAIKHAFPTDHLMINDTQWLISSPGTVMEVTAKIGIYNPAEPKSSLGSGIVFAISSYHGRAAPSTWDWIKSRLEARSHG